MCLIWKLIVSILVLLVVVIEDWVVIWWCGCWFLLYCVFILLLLWVLGCLYRGSIFILKVFGGRFLIILWWLLIGILYIWRFCCCCCEVESKGIGLFVFELILSGRLLSVLVLRMFLFVLMLVRMWGVMIFCFLSCLSVELLYIFMGVVNCCGCLLVLLSIVFIYVLNLLICIMSVGNMSWFMMNWRLRCCCLRRVFVVRLLRVWNRRFGEFCWCIIWFVLRWWWLLMKWNLV